MPDLTKSAREPLLLHQFLAGLLAAVNRQLRAIGEITTIEAAVSRARLLMTIEDHGQVAAVAETPSDAEQLRKQVAALTEQVALLSASQKTNNSQQKFRNHSCCLRVIVQDTCKRSARIVAETPTNTAVLRVANWAIWQEIAIRETTWRHL